VHNLILSVLLDFILNIFLTVHHIKIEDTRCHIAQLDRNSNHSLVRMVRGLSPHKESSEQTDSRVRNALCSAGEMHTCIDLRCLNHRIDNLPLNDTL
jgi:hypothetical protein